MIATCKSCVTKKPLTLAAQFQELKYGKGIRVMNQTKTPKDSKPSYRCSICGTVH